MYVLRVPGTRLHATLSWTTITQTALSYLLVKPTTQLGPNADIKKWEEEQMDIATVRFGARDAKEKSKVRVGMF